MRDIFNWFIGGTSVLGIAKKLNAMGIPNPSAYKRQQGMNYCHPASDKLDGLWPDSSVRRILRNPLSFTGILRMKRFWNSLRNEISDLENNEKVCQR